MATCTPILNQQNVLRNPSSCSVIHFSAIHLYVSITPAEDSNRQQRNKCLKQSVQHGWSAEKVGLNCCRALRSPKWFEDFFFLIVWTAIVLCKRWCFTLILCNAVFLSLRVLWLTQWGWSRIALLSYSGISQTELCLLIWWFSWLFF